MIFMYISYFLTGIVGVDVVLAGSITTIMRMWDGVTDPIIGYVVDKTNTKFGKNRPFIVIGNVILLATSGIIYIVTPHLPQAARFPFYIVMYMLYIIGYTCQCVVTKSAQTCLTNDPAQRPIFAMFDTVYNSLIFALLPVVVTNVLMPRFGGAQAFAIRISLSLCGQCSLLCPACLQFLPLSDCGARTDWSTMEPVLW